MTTPATVAAPEPAAATHVYQSSKARALAPSTPISTHFTAPGAHRQDSDITDSQKDQIAQRLDNLPVSFEENVGQFDDPVDFVARADGYTAFLTPSAAVFAIQGSGVRDQGSESVGQVANLPDRPEAGWKPAPQTASGVAVYMNIVGGNPAARPSARDQLPGITNYFIGNDPANWRTNISSYARVTYDDVYPGIDLVYYGNNGQLEYDFLVSPGVDPSDITLNFAGADGVDINGQGDLVLHTAAGDVVQQKPFTYQEIGAARHEVASRYVLDGAQVRFEVGGYDATQPLVIDPLVLGYSTYLGGSGDDRGFARAVDSNGNAYVSGYTLSPNFPTTVGAFDTSSDAGADGFVTKLNAAGTALVYSTYFGGSGNDYPYGIAVDFAGNAYISGHTQSPNFPTTAGDFDTSYNAGGDAFVTKLNTTGAALDYSNYLGGAGEDYGDRIAVDNAGNAYVSGRTASANFPTTAGVFDTSYNIGGDAFVTKLNSSIPPAPPSSTPPISAESASTQVSQ
jgi:hypothetical protein